MGALGRSWSLFHTSQQTGGLFMKPVSKISQINSITILQPVPNYAAWWYRYVCEQLAQSLYMTAECQLSNSQILNCDFDALTFTQTLQMLQAETKVFEDLTNIIKNGMYVVSIASQCSIK